jgi:hypothetical protein
MMAVAEVEAGKAVGNAQAKPASCVVKPVSVTKTA